MIANFFQSLDDAGVAYLLISGQATVLYGAATFSEDIDIWVRPTGENADALIAALRDHESSYYKLTPPLTSENLQRGHGFHFIIPDQPDVYVDVVGKPPRVGHFDDALSSSIRIETSWGQIPTVGIRDLVAIKSTQRLGDYPIIGQLVLRYLETRQDPSPEDLRWAIDNIYTVEDLDAVLSTFPGHGWQSDAEAVMAYIEVHGTEHAQSEHADKAEAALSERLRLARKADREYWREIIEELRTMRGEGSLMTVGEPV